MQVRVELPVLVLFSLGSSPQLNGPVGTSQSCSVWLYCVASYQLVHGIGPVFIGFSCGYATAESLMSLWGS